MRKLILLLALACLPLTAGAADLVVVANPKSGIDQMSRKEVTFVFMGRWRQLPSGLPALPIDLPDENPQRADFYRQLVNKSPSEIKAYWSRLMFSGGARPPVAADNAEEQMKLLSNTPGAIGYMERAAVDGRFKIVFDFSSSPQ